MKTRFICGTGLSSPVSRPVNAGNSIRLAQPCRIAAVASRMRALVGWALLVALVGANAPAQTAAPASEPEIELGALYEQGRQLFDELAPAEVKEQFEFPRKEQFDAFATRFQRALESEDLTQLAAYAPEARAVLHTLRALPAYEAYTDWLAERLDYAEAAATVVRRAEPQRPSRAESRGRVSVPHYDLWLARIGNRPLPRRAPELLPRVRAAFAAEGLPPDLAWLAEAESTFNPDAISPVGAKGLYQLMPATARELGLRTLFPDERADPVKNARAAARYLKQLHGRFGDWPLTLAAYNAGPGRVRRTLTAQSAKTFAEIAHALPAETRMYVPKVLAILNTRAGVPIGELPPPRAPSSSSATANSGG